MDNTNKSPNKLWRESGTSLSFADWIQREKDKGSFLVNKKFEKFANANGIKSPTEFIQDAIEKGKEQFGFSDKVDLKDNNKKDNTIFGLNKGVLLLSAVIIVGAIAYKIYQKRK